MYEYYCSILWTEWHRVSVRVLEYSIDLQLSELLHAASLGEDDTERARHQVQQRGLPELREDHLISRKSTAPHIHHVRHGVRE